MSENSTCVLSRRALLLGPAALAAAASGPPAVNIGLLGAVHSHAEGKLKVLKGSSEWRLVGVCEPDTAVRRWLQQEGIPLLSREQLLGHPDIKVIAVESAVRQHEADGLAVLEAQKHLHLEKAPAADFAAVQKIAAEARRRNLLFQVGHMWRYHPGIRKALEIARSGALGRIYLVRANISNQLQPERRPEWGEFAGGVMFELGSHLIDPIVRLMGRPPKVTPILRTDGGSDRLRDNTVAILEWDKAMAIVHASTLQPESSRHRSLEIYGTGGTVIVRPLEPPALTLELARAWQAYNSGRHEIPLPRYERYVGDFANLAAAVRGEASLPVSPEEEVLIQEAVLRCSGML